MFKKLDKLIIKAFVGPFIATFFITLLVLVMQFFWLYIDDFVGKGLGIDIVLKFIWYQSAVLIPLALPLAILLSYRQVVNNGLTLPDGKTHAQFCFSLTHPGDGEQVLFNRCLESSAFFVLGHIASEPLGECHRGYHN